jgi:predicted ABC-class ATPase
LGNRRVMSSKEDLKAILSRIDEKGYKAYKETEGSFDFDGFILHIDQAQGDPFAAPSRVRIQVPLSKGNFPGFLYDKKIKRIAFQDYVTRQLEKVIAKATKGHRGVGRSGQVGIDSPGQEILDRTAVSIDTQGVEARLTVGLPADGRRILGKEAEAIFFEEIPAVVAQALSYGSYDAGDVKLHVDAAEDQEALRGQLDEKDLVAFVGDLSVLPRKSGIDETPLIQGAVPFYYPPELEVELATPNRGRIRGMGIPRGVTLIVGGGFHGKTTLLNALGRAVYPHIPGDGRELMATLPSAVKVSVESGRGVEKVDIRPFINPLPGGGDTARFSSDDANGSTSQAANIMEALEMGAKLLLIDEDTSAANFMARDARMQELVAKEKEPITPFVDKVRKLYRDLGVSTVLVAGGSGDYFDVADTVIMMEDYRVRCVTERAREIAARHATRRTDEGGATFGNVTPRQPLPESFDASRGRRDVKIDAKGRGTILYGSASIDVTALDQLVDPAQARTIGLIIHHYCENYLDKTATLFEGLTAVMEEIRTSGLDILMPFKAGNLALPRLAEAAAAVNRLRGLKMK